MKANLWDDINKQDEPKERDGYSGIRVCNRCGGPFEWKYIPNKGWKPYNGFKPHVCKGK